MTAALSLLFFVLGTLFVWLGEPFGRLELGAPTILGLVLFSAAAPWFLIRKPIMLQMEVRHPRRHVIASTAVLLAMASWLFLVIQRFGPSPELYVLQGRIPPASTLLGHYRELLPLRAFWPPVVLATAVSVVLVANTRRRWWFAAVVILMLLFFVSVYETRYVLIWLALYYLLHKAMYVKQILRLLTPRLLLGLSTGVIAFVLLGNIRSGVDFLDAQRFAEAMAVSPTYSHLPLTAIWALIYSFSGFARGIANDHFIRAIGFSIPAKLFPGALQRVNLFTNHVQASPRYSEQAFAIDAWHSYGLQFGIVGAFLLMLCVFLVLHLIIRRIQNQVRSRGYIGALDYAILLWMVLRLALLPIGDYYLDFGAFVGLFTLALMLQIAGVRLKWIDGEPQPPI